MLAGGPAWFQALHAACRRARREILIETYIWAGDGIGSSMLRVVTAAARRGVRVRLLLDGFGSITMRGGALRPLLAAGGRVVFHNPVRFSWRMGALVHRNHRKLAVFDGRTAFIGGFAIRDDWASAPPAGRWDVGAVAAGPVVEQFRRVFARDWLSCRMPPLPPAGEAAIPDRGNEVLRLLPSVYGRRHLFRRLRLKLDESRHRAFICASYFIPSFRLRRALRRAARRGVDVRLLLPTPRGEAIAFRYAGRRHYGPLLRAGVRIFEFQPSLLHSKYLLVDGTWGVIGSTNLDNWSGRFNQEADLEALSPRAVAALAGRFLADTGRAREITRTRWARRAWWIKALERAFGLVDPWL